MKETRSTVLLVWCMSHIKETVFSLVFANDKLTCESPIGSAVNVAFTDPLFFLFFFFCNISKVNLVILEDCYPYCNAKGDALSQKRKSQELSDRLHRKTKYLMPSPIDVFSAPYLLKCVA